MRLKSRGKEKHSGRIKGEREIRERQRQKDERGIKRDTWDTEKDR